MPMRLLTLLLALAMGMGAVGLAGPSAQAKTVRAQTAGVSLIAAPGASGVAWRYCDAGTAV